MRRFLGVLLVVLLPLFSAQAEDQIDWLDEVDKAPPHERTYFGFSEALGLVSGVTLTVTDDVTDGCWTNVTAVENRIRADLERSRIPVVERQDELEVSNVFAPDLHFRVYGEDDGGACIGHSSISVSYVAFHKMTPGGLPIVHVDTIGLYQNESIIRSKSLNDLVMQNATSYIDDFSAKVLASRREEKAKEIRQKMREFCVGRDAGFCLAPIAD